MRQIEELHLQYPFAGNRMLQDILQLNGVAIGRKHVVTLMRRMRIEAFYLHPRTTTPHPGNKVFPYLLHNIRLSCLDAIFACILSWERINIDATFDEIYRNWFVDVSPVLRNLGFRKYFLLRKFLYRKN